MSFSVVSFSTSCKTELLCICGTCHSGKLYTFKRQVRLARPSPYSLTFQKVCNWIETVYMPTICLAKVSILLQLGRIFVPDNVTLSYRAIQALIALNVLFFTSCFFLELFWCSPREKIWNQALPGTCVNITLSFIITATINIVSDVSMLLMPLYWVWQLQMNSSFKWRVSAVFATGIL